VWRSTDDGATWTVRNNTTNMVNSQGWYNATIAVDPDDADRVILGGVPLWESSDGGVTVTQVASVTALGTDTDVHWDHHAIAYEPGSTNNLWVGNDGGAWKSTDDGQTWISRRDGLPTFQFYDICVSQSDPTFMTGGSQDNGFPGGPAGPDEWFVSNLIADGMVCEIHPVNGTIHAEWQFGNHVRSQDGGLSWQSTQQGISGTGNWVTALAEDPNRGKDLFTSSTSGIFRTLNGQNNWQNVAAHTAIWISVSPADGDVVYSVNSSQAHVSTDRGDTWTTMASYGFTIGPETKIQAHPTDPASAFVTFGSFNSVAKLALTTDMGATWSDVTGDLPDIPVNTMIVDPQDTASWFIGTDFGVWQSTDLGATWNPTGVGLPNVVVTDLAIHLAARKLVAGTYGRGAWELSLPGGAVAAEPAGLNVTPSVNLLLDAPRPNPVRDQAFLRFAAKHDGPVTLEVFDVQGRRVSRLTELPRGDGVVRVAPWVTADVANGVYFAVLTAGSERRAVKMTVIR